MKDQASWWKKSLRGLGKAGPTAQTAALCLLFFAFGEAGKLVGYGTDWLSLGPHYTERPWTLFTNVYAHASLSHLIANLAGLALVGLVLERFTNPFRFHTFFVLTGFLSGLAQVASGFFVAASYLTLGASGAIFALYGYVLTANPPIQALFNWLNVGPLLTGTVFVLAGGVVTYYTAAPGVALVGHFTGFFLGLIGGRTTVLDPTMTPELIKPYTG